MDGYEGDSSGNSTPSLPPINTGYDTPGSDYMSNFQNKPRHSSIGHQDNDFHTIKEFAPSPISSISKPQISNSSAKHSKRDRYSWKKVSVQDSACSKSHDPSGDRVTSPSHPKSKRRIPREITLPSTNNKDLVTKSCVLTKKASTDLGVYNTLASPMRLSLPGSAGCTKLPSAATTPDTRKPKWMPPRISTERYDEAKARIMDGGKFKVALTKYLREDIPWWEQVSDSSDDGYDTDLDKQLGFELIADEKSREILEDGAFPEYKQECRKFRSNPNNYFLRHCLEDDVQMRHRYLTKGDSITISNLIKNHLTVSTLDLEDNGIGLRGIKYFKNVLHENKHLTELYLSGNNMGPVGVKYLRSALVSNCFLQKLDISDNNIGDKGGKYCARIIEDNVALKEFNVAGNEIGDFGAILISKALASNISLKLLDVSWNKIRPAGALKFAEALKKNTELEVFIAGMNGFGDEGGRAVINTLRQNSVIKLLDLSANRMKDSSLKLLSFSLDGIHSLQELNLSANSFGAKTVAEFLASLVTNSKSLRHISLQGIPVSDEIRALCAGLRSMQGVCVYYRDPPSERQITTDILTRNLTILAKFLDDEDIDIDDLFPDYEDEDEEGMLMLTTKEVICAIECCGKISRFDKLQKLKGKVKYGKNRKFAIREFAVIYDTVISGKNPLREKPLRTHLRRSIKEEREEIERKSKQKRKSSFVPPKLPKAKK